MKRLVAAVGLLSLALFGSPSHAQTIQGRVVDAASGQPVADVNVVILRERDRVEVRTRTREDGTFVARPRSPGAFQVQGERLGYQQSRSAAVTVAKHEVVEVVLQLSTEALRVEPLRVTARREPPRRASLQASGFYDRERLGGGTFLRREDIERDLNSTMAQLLRRVRGTYMHIDGRGRQYIAFDRARSVRALRGATSDICLPLIFLNGARVQYSQAGPGQPGLDINQVVNPDAVEAIEAYPSAASLPAQYNSSEAACGLVLIWTKSER